jgi:MFS family permease
MMLLRDLNKNARVSLSLFPMWAVFWGLVYYYSPLYMRALGLDEIGIGVVSTAGTVCAFLCFLIASPLANRFGRKRTTLIFDLLSWTLPMLIWALAGNYWFFLAAGVINGLSKIVSISWNCLITEDEVPEKVPKVFTLVSLMSSAIGIFTPLAGFFIARAGLVGTMRVLYAAGALSMAAMFLIRNRFVVETRAGEKLMGEQGGMTVSESLRGFLKALSRLRGDRNFLLLAVVFIATNFVTSLNVFQVIYLKERLGYSDWNVSLVPFAVALSNVAVFSLVLPRLKASRGESVLGAFIALNLAASVLFIIIRANALWAMLAVMALNGATNFVVTGYREGVFMGDSGEHEKADRYSAVQTLTFLCCIPAGYLGGVMYRIDARLPFALAALLYAAALAAAIAFRARKKNA